MKRILRSEGILSPPEACWSLDLTGNRMLNRIVLPLVGHLNWKPDWFITLPAAATAGLKPFT